ncbi:MAG TPA: AraC family transcriptional regulator [Mobilitalea sp.]|nr:AraC family transcriptional regulator [Mobilitalea sp.]
MNSDMLEKVLAYIDAHIFEKINLCVLAEIAGYSPFYFSKLFSEAMGMPVTGYIRIRKLQYAIVSLLEGRKVLDVALLYAFDSHEGFTRAFTQLFGSTPSTINNKHYTKLNWFTIFCIFDLWQIM